MPGDQRGSVDSEGFVLILIIIQKYDVSVILQNYAAKLVIVAFFEKLP